VNSILGVRDKAIVLLLAKTGMRRRELISVDLSDVDWIEQSITLKPRQFKKRSNRTVFFDDETARVLRVWLTIRQKLHADPENNN